MALTDDEKTLLEKLTAKAKEPDGPDSSEIEIYDTKAGKGARIPFHHGARWLFETFGIGDAPAAPAEGEGTGKAAGAAGGSGAGQGGSVSYFGGTRRSG